MSVVQISMTILVLTEKLHIFIQRNIIYVCVYIYYIYFKNTSYLLVKIALRFLSKIPKIYVDPRGITQGVLP